MSKRTPTKSVTHYRDSGNGRFITKRQAERRDPRTWEKERIRTDRKK